MGSVCCGLRDELDDYTNPNNSIYRNCICVRCFLQNLLYMRTSLFPRGEEHARLASPSQWTSLSLDNSLSDVYRSPPRPLPYNSDPRYLRLQRDEPTSRPEKSSTHSQEESEPLRSDNDTNKPNNFMGGEEEEEAKNPQRNSYSKETTGFTHIYSSLEEDEDVCPTCLEGNVTLKKEKTEEEHPESPPSGRYAQMHTEYTMENPKIITKCSHHYHLGCIYEWMERSDTCPVCGKVMAFDETS